MKDGLKELGKLAWSALGIILLVTLVLWFIIMSAYQVAKESVNEHFKNVHHVECEH